LSIFIPDFDFPEAELSGSEGFAGIDDVDGLGTCDFAGVPEVRGIEFVGVRGDDDLVSGLLFATFSRFDAPSEARVEFVETERRLEVLAAESDGGQRSSKNQAPKKLQIPKIKTKFKARCLDLKLRVLLEFEIWCLMFLWSLVFGTWSFFHAETLFMRAKS
jgi:hypothetical protein